MIIYHGTSVKANADGIIRDGLHPYKGCSVGGGGAMPSMGGRSYVGKELWNAVRYSFMLPHGREWPEFAKTEPYGFVFFFRVSSGVLLPDEDAIGAAVNDLLNGGSKNLFLRRYVADIDKRLLAKVRAGEFKAFAEVGRTIEPELSAQDMKTVVKQSATATVDKVLRPVGMWRIPKPEKQFFKTTQEYEDYAKKHHTARKLAESLVDRLLEGLA